MKLSFLTSSRDAVAAHIIEFLSPTELHHWLIQDSSGTAWMVAAWCGSENPVMVLGPRAGYLTIRGGWNCPEEAAQSVWDAATHVIDKECGMDEFLGGRRNFTRKAIYPTLKEIK